METLPDGGTTGNGTTDGGTVAIGVEEPIGKCTKCGGAIRDQFEYVYIYPDDGDHFLLRWLRRVCFLRLNKGGIKWLN